MPDEKAIGIWAGSLSRCIPISTADSIAEGAYWMLDSHAV
jgi:hypothetical protein